LCPAICSCFKNKNTGVISKIGAVSFTF
jgi:hypothetical protein